MKLHNVADTVVHRAALDQFLAESAANALLAATTEIVQCSGAGGATSQFVGLGWPALDDGGGANRPPEREPLDLTLDAKPRQAGAHAAARPERFDVAHRQLYDYVDQRARRLVRIDEEQFDGLASTFQ
jgi:hypothetical protein